MRWDRYKVRNGYKERGTRSSGWGKVVYVEQRNTSRRGGEDSRNVHLLLLVCESVQAREHDTGLTEKVSSNDERPATEKKQNLHLYKNVQM